MKSHKEKDSNLEIQDTDLSVFNEHEENHSEFVDKIKKNKAKAGKALKGFFRDLNNEAIETKEASKILVKFLKEGHVSKEEEKELKTQVYDLFKMVGIGIPFFMIPGSSLLLPFLVKISSRYGINLLPTSFDHSGDQEEE